MLLRRRSQYPDFLRKVPMFADLSKRQLELVSRHTDVIERPAGAMLVRQGEVGRELLILVDGTARVERDGKVIAQLGPGDFLGEMALLDGKPRAATVITETPTTLLVVERRSFQFLLDTVPELSRKMLVTLCARLRDLQDRFLD